MIEVIHVNTPFQGAPAPTQASVAALLLLVAACSSGAGADGPDNGPSGGGNGPNLGDITTGAYMADDGLIVVEMESGAAGGDWAEQTSLTGFTGSSYLTWTGANHFSNSGVDPFGFDLWIEDAGTYAFRIHNRHDFHDSTEANDLWVRMDDGDWVKCFSWERGLWTWATQQEFSHSNKPQASYTLSAGNHRIEFSGRSTDFSADRFHLFNPSVVDPMNTSYPESARAGASNREAGPGGAGFIGANPALTSLVTLNPSAIWPEAAPALAEATGVQWNLPGARFADGTHSASTHPVAVLDGGVALPVVFQGTVAGQLETRMAVLNVEGAAVLSGSLTVNQEIELLFSDLKVSSIELVGPLGEQVKGIGVGVKSGTRVTTTPVSEGVWLYRGRDEVTGHETEGSFLVLGPMGQ